MRQETKEVYFCDHCARYYLTKHHINRHEKICGYNAENSYKCNSCQHKKDTGIDSCGFMCEAYQSFVFKPVTRHYTANTLKICRVLNINEPIYVENNCEMYGAVESSGEPFGLELVKRFEKRFGKILDC